MNILYFHQYFGTRNSHGGTRSYEFAKRWVKAGHKVTVVTGPGSDESIKFGHQTIDGISVYCYGLPYSNKSGYPYRVFCYIGYAIISSLFAIFSFRYNIVVATSTPLTVAVPALLAKIIGRRKVVFEVRDVWPDAAIQAGILKNKIQIKFLRKFEIFTYQKVDWIIPLSNGMMDNIAAKGIPYGKMTMLPNCSDIDLFSFSYDARTKNRRKFKCEDKFVVLYMGSISLANDIPFLFEVINITRNDPFFLWWFVGEGNRAEFLKEKVKINQINNVRFWGRQEKSQLPKFTSAADVGVVSFIDKPVYFENSPNKFFDYSAAGIPSVFTRTTWLKPIIKRYNSGYVCDSNSVFDFANKLNHLQRNPAEREEMGLNAKRMAEREFSRDSISKLYLERLISISSSCRKDNN